MGIVNVAWTYFKRCIASVIIGILGMRKSILNDTWHNYIVIEAFSL